MKFSQRSTRYFHEHPPLLDAVCEAWRSLYCPDNNPTGLINLGVAENGLLQDWLVQRFQENFNLEPKDLQYQPLDGPTCFKEAMCYVLNRYFIPAVPVQPEHVLCGSGVTAMLAQTLYTICDEGDGVLIQKPYFSGFNHLITQGITLIGYNGERPLDPSSVLKTLEATLQDQTQVKNIKAVLICNPHNPLGYCTSKEILIMYLKFCQNHQLHLIVDEIYALSVYKQDDDHHFISALSLNPTEFDVDGSRLHVLYGISKDFGCAGLRAGILISQNNSELLQFIKNFNLRQVQISTLTALNFSHFVFGKDKENEILLLDSYVIENQKQMLQAHEYVTERLKSLNIKYNEGSNSGFFLMIDLRNFLSTCLESESDQAKETSIFLKLLNEYKIYLAPGSYYHCPEPGFFRLTFTVPRSHLEVGLQRLAKFVQSSDTATTIDAIESLTV